MEFKVIREEITPPIKTVEMHLSVNDANLLRSIVGSLSRAKIKHIYNNKIDDEVTETVFDFINDIYKGLSEELGINGRNVH